jgi:DNA uptake protein ComE-like DNA-binding protein
MSWQDFFHFSRGERQALTVLLCLVGLTGTLLFLINTDQAEEEMPVAAPPVVAQADTAVVQQQQPSATTMKSSPYTARSTEKKSESYSERTKRLTSPTRPTYTRTVKFEKGVVVEMNTADTLTLQKIPGIGPAYARRIANFRNLLGGYYTVEQLGEVYGIDEETYHELAPWFTVDASHIKRLTINTLPVDSLSKHPYIKYSRARAIDRLRRQKKHLTGWEDLQLLKEFDETDKARLEPYLSFE